MSSRRRALKTAAGAAAVLPVLGQHQHAPDTSAASAYKAKWASAEEMKQLAAVCDMIIPRTETPGASDAKVQEYIDYALAGDPSGQTQLRDGLRWLFALPDAERLPALRKASETPASTEGRFFRRMKDLTIDGYYQSREGLVTELGWQGNTFLAEFPGCAHPEHQ